MKGVIKLNTFFEYEGIIGKAETAHLDRALREFFELAAAIRRGLGKQGYLLDKYVSCVLEAANATLLFSSADDGFQTFSDLRNLCLEIMDGKTDNKGHSLYEKIKEHIGAHPLAHQERYTKLSVYCVALAGDFLEYAAERFALEQRKEAPPTFDMAYLRDLYRQISTIIGGEEQLERLNLLIRQRFMLVTPMAGFLQGMADDLLHDLVYRDAESSRQVFQLLMDSETTGEAL